MHAQWSSNNSIYWSFDLEALASSSMASHPPRPSVLVMLCIFFSSLAFLSSSSSSFAQLSPDFYSNSCPNVQKIITDYLQPRIQHVPGIAAGLLRLHFHDCWVQGCDGSVLLDAVGNIASEKDAVPNKSLRPAALNAIDDLRVLIDSQCKQKVVSCTDILTLAARDAVALTGGSNYSVLLGRRDGLLPSPSVVLPAPFFDASTLISIFPNFNNLDTTDMVALSGAHTLGVASCPSFSGRNNPAPEPNLNQTLADKIRRTCNANPSGLLPLDKLTPNQFDNGYYVDLVNREGLLHSDQDLFTNPQTSGIVTQFAQNQDLFFQKFASAMVKLGGIQLMTGSMGEIRTNCKKPNANTATEDLLIGLPAVGDGLKGEI